MHIDTVPLTNFISDWYLLQQHPAAAATPKIRAGLAARGAVGPCARLCHPSGCMHVFRGGVSQPFPGWPAAFGALAWGQCRGALLNPSCPALPLQCSQFQHDCAAALGHEVTHLPGSAFTSQLSSTTAPPCSWLETRRAPQITSLTALPCSCLSTQPDPQTKSHSLHCPAADGDPARPPDHVSLTALPCS